MNIMKKALFNILIFICIFVITGCSTHMAQKGAMSGAYDAVEEQRYTHALKKLSDAERYQDPSPDLKAEIMYLRSTCYEGMEKYTEAIGALKYIVDNFPDSSYAYQAQEKLLEYEK